MIRRDRDLVPDRKTGLSRSDWIKGALIALVLAFFVRLAVHGFLVFPLSIASPDMEPTFAAGDSPFFLKIFDPAKFKRGDVVLLRHPHNPDLRIVRRIIALPGEQVQIFERRVFVNNQPIDAAGGAAWEKQIASSIRYPGEPVRTGSVRRDFAGPIIVPEGQIFVLGDNRLRALDSRQLGPVPLTDVEALLWQ